MQEKIYHLSNQFLRIYNRPYKRYFFKRHTLSNRLSIIVGQRGVGKTTSIVQHLLSLVKGDLSSSKILYVPSDHFLLGKTSLYEIAENFYNNSGKYLCFDEIHKYKDWSKELKSIHDTFTELTVIASGSSALEIHKGSHDLSRRAVVYEMTGLSLREFIEIKSNVELPEFSFNDIFANHQKCANEVLDILKNKNVRILPIYKEYLKNGFYPYFFDYKDLELFYKIVEQNIHTTIESDLLAIYPQLSGHSINKIRNLLAYIGESVPFTPDMTKIKEILGVGDERTLKTYLKYLEDAGVIICLAKKGKNLGALLKPEKIYLNNTNQIYSIGKPDAINIGNVRETFLINSIKLADTVKLPLQGDFYINDKYTVEVGGKNKSFKQIQGIKNSYLAVDDIETGFENKIPLWLFGFLY